MTDDDDREVTELSRAAKYTPPLLGRTVERRRLWEALDAAPPGGVSWISGAAGAG